MTLKLQPAVPIETLPSHITPSQYARLYGRSVGQIHYLTTNGRIPTVEVLGVAMIPSATPYPKAYPQNPAKLTRNAAIIARANAGETYTRIADDYGITRQRVEQIVLRGR